MIRVEQLQAAIYQRVEAFNHADYPLASRPQQLCALEDALGQVLAADVIAAFAIPRQNLSAMDGFAIAKASELAEATRLTVVGESQAGKPYCGELQAGQAVRIFTGAVVPPDCDTVVMQENTDYEDIKPTLDKSQPYQIALSHTGKHGANIRHQGEEIQQDEILLSTGKRLNPTDISLLANMGYNSVHVYKPLTVGIIATGDELAALGTALTSKAQIYNSNTPTLKALLKPLPIRIIDYGIIADDRAATLECVQAACVACDVLISSAGVSVGDYDYLTDVIRELGQINHYKVAMKPGKPFVFGELSRQHLGILQQQPARQVGQAYNQKVLYFGLPGNPLSVVVSALQFVIPALWQAAGVSSEDRPKRLTVTATLTTEVKKSAGRTDFQRGVLTQAEDGSYQVAVFASQQSHRIKQLSCANCLLVLPQDSTDRQAGEQVQVQPFSWLWG